jgi:hypothetical protein
MRDLTEADLRRYWTEYDSEDSRLDATVRQIPLAQIAVAAATSAMKERNDSGRATWEGFTRALYVIARAAGEI